MSELLNWVSATLGHDQWPKVKDIPQIPNQRSQRIISHYEREIVNARLTLAQAYERCCDDLQGRNHHETRPQRGKNYRAITLNVLKGERP